MKKSTDAFIFCELKKKLLLKILLGICFSYGFPALSADVAKTDPDKESGKANTSKPILSGEEKKENLISNVLNTVEEGEKSSLHDLFKNLDYPELQVVPRASQRLKMESAEENDNWWYIHWPLYASALATFGLGITAEQSFRDDLNSVEKKDGRSAALISKTVGASWFIGTMLVVSRKPYQKAFRKLKNFSGSGRSNELLRERLSEEALEQSAHHMKILTYASVFTNLVATGYMAHFLNEKGRIFAVVTGALSFLPIIFDDWYLYNYQKQMEYKKNIFSPVVSLSSQLKNEGKIEYYPSVAWTWEY